MKAEEETRAAQFEAEKTKAFADYNARLSAAVGFKLLKEIFFRKSQKKLSNQLMQEYVRLHQKYGEYPQNKYDDYTY